MTDWWVICLCAGWCGVCRDWRPAFEQAASESPGVRFAWVDVEDEADAMGDIDIETFPTVLVGHEGRALFLGPVQPTAAHVTRLVASLQAQPQPSATLPGDAQGLLVRLRERVMQGGAL